MNENIKAEKLFTELNKVAGFDPLKLAKKIIRGGAELLHLELRYKKLWFRMKYPQGRIKVSPLKITDQLAIMEAKVYFDKNDAEPVSSYISQRYAKDLPALYIESAHQTAVDQALSDAGFGLQLLSSQSTTDVQAVKEPPALRVVPAPSKSADALPLTQDQQKQTAAAISTEPSQPEEHAEKTEPALIHEVKAPTSMAIEEVVSNEVAVEEPEQPEPAVILAVEAPTPMAIEKVTSNEAISEEPEQPEPALIHEVKASTPMAIEEVASIEVAAEEPEQPNETDQTPDQVTYPEYMSAEDICSMMTREEAGKVIVDIGTCKGLTLQQVLERRPVSLKWYLKGYTGNNNILRAGAMKILSDYMG